MKGTIVTNSSDSGFAIIAGSGMNALGDRLCASFALDDCFGFEQLEGMGDCTVEGHRGEVMMGRLAGSDRKLAVVMGRRHLYEGGESTMAPLVGWLASSGFRDLVTLSAAGSVHNGISPGELVVINAVIDLQNRPRFYPRGSGPVRFFPSGPLTLALEQAASRSGRTLIRGNLACSPGPTYESPAEIYALQTMGADVATMSAAPEAWFALSSGMQVAIIAAVTNHGTGIGHETPDHGRVLDAAETMCEPLGDILVEFLEGV